MKKIEDLRILVIGDIMLDKYVVGEVERISPEAPVPIVRVYEEFSQLGGCGNVARNIKSIGANVDCIAAIAVDDASYLIRNHLEEIGIGEFLFKGTKTTTVKERVVANSKRTQMIRVDRESTETIDAELIIKLRLESYFDVYKPDFVVISDYAKGVISWGLMKYIKARTKNNIIVDPKPQNALCYNGVFMITPNEKEWNQMITSSASRMENVKYILVTKGKHGMQLRDFNQHWDIPAENVHVIYNVSGAGDTVVAVMSVCLSLGLNPVSAAKIANSCASYVVTLPGTEKVPEEYFLNALKKYGG